MKIEGVDLPGLGCGASPDSPGGYHIQGPPGARFVYLSWGTVDGANNFELFRRAKLWLDSIPPEVIEAAEDEGLLVGRLGLTDPTGNPLCAAVRPPVITSSEGSLNSRDKSGETSQS
ncbi:MAG: DUF5990 family protein [Actinomycetota bacterium]|nr:DUF5990 family protein [Actinomycetota bacterium]